MIFSWMKYSRLYHQTHKYSYATQGAQVDECLDKVRIYLDKCGIKAPAKTGLLKKKGNEDAIDTRDE